jgi:hypothetical protein
MLQWGLNHIPLTVVCHTAPKETKEGRDRRVVTSYHPTHTVCQPQYLLSTPAWLQWAFHPVIDAPPSTWLTPSPPPCDFVNPIFERKTLPLPRLVTHKEVSARLFLPRLASPTSNPLFLFHAHKVSLNCKPRTLRPCSGIAE